MGILDAQESQLLDNAFLSMRCKSLPQTIIDANQELHDLEQDIQNWNNTGRASTNFIYKHILGAKANSISNEGSAPTFGHDIAFAYFMNDKTTLQIIQGLFDLKLSSINSTLLPKKIYNLGYLQWLDSYFKKSKAPRLYAHRMLLMLFPDQFTTVASPSHVAKLYKRFKISNIPYEKGQYQIRFRIDEYIAINNLQSITRFEKAALAWFIN